MANCYHQVYIQAVFAVKYRAAVLAKEIRPKVFGIMGNLIKETGCKTIIVNGVEDHVHCFLGLKPTLSISNLMQKVKGSSSYIINKSGLTKDRFEWQEGYGVFSYSRSAVSNVYRYIAQQEQRHTQQSLLEEYKGLLDEFDVPYEDQYLFEDLI